MDDRHRNVALDSLIAACQAAGTEIPSYTSRHLETGNITPHTEDLIKFGAFAIYGGKPDVKFYGRSTGFLILDRSLGGADTVSP